MPKEIIKRDGSVEAWDGEKIANAIRKGFNAAGLRCNGIANLITTNV